MLLIKEKKLKFKSKIGKFLKVRITLPAQEAVPGQTISVALGQHGIKTQEFIKNFNNLTLIYPKGLLISTVVEINHDNTFKIDIKGLEISSILKNCLNSDNILKIEYLYLISLISLKNKLLYSNINILSIMKSLYGSLKSKKIKIN